MMIRSLPDVIEMLADQYIQHESISDTILEHALVSHTMIKGVSTDSRTVKQGNLFVPLMGEQFDGHVFIEQAVKQGAVAVLCQYDHGPLQSSVPILYVNDTLQSLQQLAKAYRRQIQVKVIGITGSNGKTSTKDMIAMLLSIVFRVHKTKGNLNNHIGLPLTLLEMPEDTQYAVIEMGMSARHEIERLSQLAEPNVAVITMIGESHMLQLGSRLEIARAKCEILSGLSNEGLFVYDGDEPLFKTCLDEIDLASSVTRRTFGRNPHNDLYATNISIDEEGTRFTTNRLRLPLFVPLLGAHHVNNALAAIIVAEHFGVTLEQIDQGLRKIQLTKMRTERLDSPQGYSVLNDAYNASPSSVKAAIHLMEQLNKAQRKIIVLGDMLELGSHEVEYHQQIGAHLSPSTFAYVFTYGSLAMHIAEQAMKSFGDDRVKAFLDKEKLIEALTLYIQSGDVILVKGSRGMKLEEVVNRLMTKA
jgi:UDP-N-acetylmuramoyl-tripeptide--D-alanyl-D-alanine ligase